MERAAGIEPASLAWKAKVLPLHNARSANRCLFQWSFGVKRDVCGDKLCGANSGSNDFRFRPKPTNCRFVWRCSAASLVRAFVQVAALSEDRLKAPMPRCGPAAYSLTFIR